MAAARLSRRLGWPLAYVKAMTLREVETMTDLLIREDRERRIANAHRKARRG